MSKAEQDQCLDPWSTVAPANEDKWSSCDPSYVSEEDEVVWPPVIARIRDLDKPVVPKAPAPAPAPAPVSKTHTVLNSVSVKKSEPQRSSRNISSRLIALAGIIIFLAAIAPFMHLRDRNNKNETADNAWQPTTPGVNAGSNPTWPGGTIDIAQPARKTISQPFSTPPALLTNKDNPPASVTPGAPPLHSLPEKMEAPENSLAKPLPEKTMSSPAVMPTERIASRPAPARADISVQSRPSGIAVPPSRTNANAERVAEVIGEFEPLPYPNPAKVDPSNAENQLLRATPEFSKVSPPSAPAGLRAPPMIPNQPLFSGANPPPAMTNPLPPNPNMPIPYAPRPTATAPGNDSHETYQADARGGYHRSYNYIPDYRLNPAPDYRTNTPPNGQLPPLNGQYPPANAQYPPANSPYPPYNRQIPPPDSRGEATPPQAPLQYYPPQRAPAAYPVNQPVPSNSPSGMAAGAGQYLPAYSNYPSAVPPGTVNPGTGNADGYHVPPMTENPPIRY